MIIIKTCIYYQHIFYIFITIYQIILKIIVLMWLYYRLYFILKTIIISIFRNKYNCIMEIKFFLNSFWKKHNDNINFMNCFISFFIIYLFVRMTICFIFLFLLIFQIKMMIHLNKMIHFNEIFIWTIIFFYYFMGIIVLIFL